MENITKDTIFEVVPKDVIKDIFEEFELELEDGIHGAYHWARVIENGWEIAQDNGANMKVIVAFGFFHDCKRENDGDDPDHGFRGGEFMEKYRHRLNLTDEEFRKAQIACAGHTDVLHDNDLDIGTCWDSDRLDLLRVGIMPDPDYLNNEISKNPDFIEVRSEYAEYDEEMAWMFEIIEDIHSYKLTDYLKDKVADKIKSSLKRSI